MRLAIFIVTIICFQVSLFAATSGTLQLTGTYPLLLDITVIQQAGHDTLDLINGANRQLVATISEYSNSSNGFTISATSANNGLLTNGSLSSVPYSLWYDNINLDMASGTIQAKSVSTVSATHTDSSNVEITFSGSSDLLQGEYSDTITFVISTN